MTIEFSQVKTKDDENIMVDDTPTEGMDDTDS